jgi:predicted nucleic acid-binding protein
MMFVDTAYLLALARPQDEYHARALAWANAAKKPLISTEYVVWEVVNGLSKLIDRPKAIAVLDGVGDPSSWQVIAASGELTGRGIQIFRQHQDKEWSLTDCISFVVMRELNISNALTSDRHFEQAGFEALLRRDPP